MTFVSTADQSPLSDSRILAQTIIHCDSIEAIDVDAVWRKLNEFSVVSLRGLVAPARVAEHLLSIKRKYSPANDRKRGPGEYSLIKANYQRLCLGITGGAPGYTNARFFRCYYNPLWADDMFGMHPTFRRMIELRNRLTGLPPDFAADTEERGLWSACRIQHYPRGGGFLIPHTDEAAHGAVRRAGIETSVNLILLMTKRGVDFEGGGGFVEVKGRKVYYEDDYEVGDLVIYDETNLHGVDDIDPLAPLDMNSPEGRYTAFVTLMTA